MSDTSGPMWPQPLARWDRDSSFWRTSPDTSLWDLPMSLGTLPRSGMTRDGLLYELPTPALPTVAPASSSSAGPTEQTLLPTPTVMDMGANYTPQEWEAWKARQKATHANGNGHGASLTQEAISLLPTPTSASSGSTPESHLARKPGRKQVTDLTVLVEHGLIGAATPPPSDAGNASSDDQHQPPLFPAGTGDPDSPPDSWNG